MARLSRLSTQKLHSDSKLRQIGAGAPSNLSNNDIVSLFNSALNCAIYALPSVAKVQWEFGGPLNTESVQRTLGSQIDILGSGSNPAGVDEVYTTPGFINGEFQTHVLACAVGFHLEAPPMGWTARGNAFSAAALTSAQAKPFSPDVWTVADATPNTGAWGPNVPVPVAPAYLRYGTWANLAFWYMVRAYSLRWTFGSMINIMDEQLRDTAYMPPNAQEGSAGTSQQDILWWAKETNDRYTNLLGTNLVFATVDTLRIGSQGTSGIGLFAPSRDFEFVDVVYGGSDLRSALAGNTEFRTLSNPYILKPGVPPGLILEEGNTDLGNKFRAQFDATNGLGGSIPADYTEFGKFNLGPGTSFTERTVDGVNVSQKVVADRVEFKCGSALMSVEIKGFEISESLAAKIRDDDNLKAQLCSECGCMVGWAG
jgi:hypothetical protein